MRIVQTVLDQLCRKIKSIAVLIEAIAHDLICAFEMVSSPIGDGNGEDLWTVRPELE